MTKRVPLKLLETGVPGLDRILGGGLPELSFNLITGIPGSGKTTLAHQIMFSLANSKRHALYFTLLGEPPVKMLRYQQQFAFFDSHKVGRSIRFVSIAAQLLQGDLHQVLKAIVTEVESFSPALVFVDSFRSIVLATKGQPRGESQLQHFVQELGTHLTAWEATTFLVGEHDDSESHANPIFTVADGLIWLTQETYHGSMVRKLEVKKMRGLATLPGLHTISIGSEGIQAFPRAILGSQGPSVAKPAPGRPPKRLSLGVKRLDEMLGGGLPAGYSLLVAGPSGSGKTIMATEFLAEGLRRGENGVIAAFEKSPGLALSATLDRMVRSGKVGLISTRSLDMSIDVTLHQMSEMVRAKKAKRVVIDSVSGFELALAPTFREDFRDSLYRMISALTGLGVSVLVTLELEDRYGDLRFSPYGAAFLTDAIIVQRYVQLESEVRRCIAVVKVRNSDHSKALREFTIVKGRMVIGEPISGYEGLLVGRAARVKPAPSPGPNKR